MFSISLIWFSLYLCRKVAFNYFPWSVNNLCNWPQRRLANIFVRLPQTTSTNKKNRTTFGTFKLPQMPINIFLNQEEIKEHKFKMIIIIILIKVINEAFFSGRSTHTQRHPHTSTLYTVYKANLNRPCNRGFWQRTATQGGKFTAQHK